MKTGTVIAGVVTMAAIGMAARHDEPAIQFAQDAPQGQFRDARPSARLPIR